MYVYTYVQRIFNFSGRRILYIRTEHTAKQFLACKLYKEIYIAENPVSQCRRWCRKQKKYIDVPRPAVVECYNKHMGGVDLADMLLDLYKINYRSPRSTVVVNIWLLYRRDLKNQVTRTKYTTLLDFQLSIANELLHASNITSINPRKRGRPSAIPERMEPGSSSPASPVPSNVSEISMSSSSSKRSYISEPPKSMRLDQTGHWVEWGGKGRCRLCQTGIPKSKCSKCKVHLCCNPQKNCFVSYNT